MHARVELGPRLPLEVLEMVADALCGLDLTHALAAALVCRSFADRSRRSIFHCLVLDGLPSLTSFHNLYLSKHRLPLYVRSLTIRGKAPGCWDSAADDGWEVMLTNIVQRMVHLRKLKFDTILWATFPSAIYSALSSFPLTHLHIRKSVIDKPIRLFHFLRQCTRLQDLVLGPGLQFTSYDDCDSEEQNTYPEPSVLHSLYITCNQATRHLASFMLNKKAPLVSLHALEKLNIYLHDATGEGFDSLGPLNAVVMQNLVKASRSTLQLLDAKLLQSTHMVDGLVPPFTLDFDRLATIGFDICDVPGFFYPAQYVTWWTDTFQRMASPHALGIVILRMCIDTASPSRLTIVSSRSMALWEKLDSVLAHKRFSGLRSVGVYMTSVRQMDHPDPATMKVLQGIRSKILESMVKLRDADSLTVQVL